MLNFIDFRDASYQGEIRNGQPHGLGIVIDSNQLFCLAQWAAGRIDGPAFIVFPDCKVFCGRLRDGKMDGLCCFYLQDKIQVYMNYNANAQRMNNLIAVLPFCKLIMEIDHSQEEHPKVKRYQNYNVQKKSLNEQLTELFGKYYGLDQYRSWRDFLLINFINQYETKLFYRVIPSERYNEYFMGVKWEGIGIKMLVFHDQQDAHKFDGSPLMVSSMGKYSTLQDLKGYGLKLLDFQFFSKFQEGLFTATDKQTSEFSRKNRPNKLVKLFQLYLLKSVFFENKFINLSYLYRLEKVYSKIKVSLVEETNKIALVTMEKGNHSEVEIAQIQNRRQRKRSRTPPKTNESNILKNFQQNSKRQINTEVKGNNSIQISPNSFSEVRRSILGSVQKIKKNNPEQRAQAFRRYENVFPQIQGQDLQVSKRKTPNKLRNEEGKVSPLSKNISTDARDRKGIQRSQNKQYSIRNELEKRQSYFSRNLTEKELLPEYKKKQYSPSIFERLQEKSVEYEPNFNNTQNHNSYKRVEPKKIEERQYLPIKIDYQRPVISVERKQIYDSKSKQKNTEPFNSFNSCQPLYKTIMNEDVYSRYYQRIHDKQEQLKYFNNLIEYSRNNQKSRPQVKDKLLQENSFVTHASSSTKSPGKIRVVKRKKNSQFQY